MLGIFGENGKQVAYGGLLLIFMWMCVNAHARLIYIIMRVRVKKGL